MSKNLNRIRKILPDDNKALREINFLINSELSDKMMKKQWLLESSSESNKTENPDYENIWNHVIADPRMEKHQQPRIIPIFLRYAAVFIFGLICFIAGQCIQSRKASHTGHASVNTLRGVRSEVRLPDGSRVWLNSGSSMRYLDGFGKTSRDVILDGEAYFLVEKNPDLPFRVRVKNNTITALGTQFYLNSYNYSENLSAGLIEGSIGIETSGNQYLVLDKPESLVLSARTGTMKQRGKLQASQYAWKNGILIFEDSSLKDIGQRLTNWFNTTVEVEKAIENQRFTLTIKDENIEEVLELIKLASSLDYEKTSEGYLIKKGKN